MKLGIKLSAKQFIISQFLILVGGLIFILGLYYILNIQNISPISPFAGGPVTTRPKTLRLDLDQPDDDTLSFQSSILISGKTASRAEVLILTDTQNLVLTSNLDGSFSTVLNLEQGVNEVTVVVFDRSGDSRSLEKSVYYSKEKLQ